MTCPLAKSAKNERIRIKRKIICKIAFGSKKHIFIFKVKVKSPPTGHVGPEGSRRVKAPSFRDNGTVSSFRDNGTVPSFRDNGTVPSFRDNGTVPSFRDNGTVPSFRDNGTVLSFRDNGTVPSFRDNCTVRLQ